MVTVEQVAFRTSFIVCLLWSRQFVGLERTDWMTNKGHEREARRAVARRAPLADGPIGEILVRVSPQAAHADLGRRHQHVQRDRLVQLPNGVQSGQANLRLLLLRPNDTSTRGQ